MFFKPEGEVVDPSTREVISFTTPTRNTGFPPYKMIRERILPVLASTTIGLLGKINSTRAFSPFFMDSLGLLLLSLLLFLLWLLLLSLLGVLLLLLLLLLELLLLLLLSFGFSLFDEIDKQKREINWYCYCHYHYQRDERWDHSNLLVEYFPEFNHRIRSMAMQLTFKAFPYLSWMSNHDYHRFESSHQQRRMNWVSRYHPSFEIPGRNTLYVESNGSIWIGFVYHFVMRFNRLDTKKYVVVAVIMRRSM